MDDLKYGTRNKRGDWAPTEPARLAPLFAFPPKPLQLLKWLPGYFAPYNLFFFATALIYWFFVLPDFQTMKSLEFVWIFNLYLINALGIFIFYGAVELKLYILRTQGSRFKYHGKFPADHPSDVFWFNSQNIDNALRTFLMSIPIWTLTESVILYVYANEYVPWIRFDENPGYVIGLILLVPVIHEAHFFCIHWLIHQEPLYKWVHKVHHNSINPTPWSSMSMHPGESSAYFASGWYHLLIPSHPFVALYQLHHAAFGAIPGHIGFDKIEFGENASLDTHAYLHCLHHKHFDVNYGDGLIPLDKWFGTFHDGSAAAEARMRERFRKKKERITQP